MKQLVCTNGPYSLLDPANNEVIHKNRPTVVAVTFFVEGQRGSQIKVLADLPDEATDADWVGFFTEAKGDMELAIESFKASYLPVEGDDKTKKKPGRPPKTDGA